MQTAHAHSVHYIRLVQILLWGALLAMAIAWPAHAGITYSWTGGASNLWSNQNNWNPVGVPANGDGVAFPAGAANPTNINDLPAGTSLFAIALNGSNYTLSGNGVVLTGTLSTLGGNNTVNLPIDVQANSVAFQLQGGVNISGPLSGTGPILIRGMSRWTGTHPYSGTITVQCNVFCGDFQLNGASLASATIANQYVVAGNGTVGNLSNTNTVAPGGNNSGCCNSNGTATLNTGSLVLGGSLPLDINGPAAGTGYDQLNATGTVTLNSANLNLSMASNFAVVTGHQFVLINNDGTDAVSGTFNGRPEGSIVSLNGAEFTLSYQGGDGNDVTLTATLVPKIWTGAAGTLWSQPGNWIGGVPQSGDAVLFPSNATNLSNTNDLAPGTALKSISLTGSNYTLSGNGVVLTGTLSTLGGNNTVNLPIDVQANSVAFQLQGGVRRSRELRLRN